MRSQRSALLLIPRPCTLLPQAVLDWLSQRPAVHWLAPAPRLRLRNYQASVITQSAQAPPSWSTSVATDPAFHPIWAAGITGTGQIVGCGDSGVGERGAAVWEGLVWWHPPVGKLVCGDGPWCKAQQFGKWDRSGAPVRCALLHAMHCCWPHSRHCHQHPTPPSNLHHPPRSLPQTGGTASSGTLLWTMPSGGPWCAIKTASRPLTARAAARSGQGAGPCSWGRDPCPPSTDDGCS